MSESEMRISEVLENIASRKGASLHVVVRFFSLIIAFLPRILELTLWNCRKHWHIPATRNAIYLSYHRPVEPEHLSVNIKALSIDLSEEEMNEIDNAVPFDWPRLPFNFIFCSIYDLTLGASDVSLTRLSAHIDGPEYQRPVAPRK